MNKYQKYANKIAKYIALELMIKYDYYTTLNSRTVYSGIKKWPHLKIVDFKKYCYEELQEAIKSYCENSKTNKHY